MVYRGIVKDKVVVLEDSVDLPEGSLVQVTPIHPRIIKIESIKRVLDHPITKYVGIDEVIEEDKHEREKGEGTWLRPST